MGRGKSLSENEKGKIEGYKASGKSNREIATLLKRSPTLIDNYVKNPIVYGTAKSPGRPPKVTARLSREIIRQMSNKSTSLNKVASSLPVKVCKTTVYNVVKKSKKLVHKKLMRSPALKDTHKAARREFAIKNMATNWNNVS